MKKIVLVNIDFKDVYTGKLHKAGDRVEMTDERITEVRSVSPEFISVIGTVNEPEPSAGGKTADKTAGGTTAKNSK